MKQSRLQINTTTKLLHFFSKKLQPGVKIPSELSLSKQFEVSRTVIRKVILQLQTDGVIDETKKLIHLDAKIDIDVKSQSTESSELIFRNYFYHQIQNGFILPGRNFSVLELANQSGCNRTIVREFLYQFSRYGLVKKLPRRTWGMVDIDKDYIKELLSTRKDLEIAAVEKHGHVNTSQTILHLKEILAQINHTVAALKSPGIFQKYEAAFYTQLFKVENNRFISEYYSNLHFISCFLYQWIPIETLDQIEYRYAYITQLTEDIETHAIKNGTTLVNEFYGTLSIQLEESLQLLFFP